MSAYSKKLQINSLASVNIKKKQRFGQIAENKIKGLGKLLHQCRKGCHHNINKTSYGHYGDQR